MADPDLGNPFNVTKAVDFSDSEIMATWVPSPLSADPRSPMPAVLLGGKGSGRTHQMRHMTLAVQLLRHGDKPLSGISDDGYVGVYVRCGGLNAGRFSGKGQSDEAWDAVFSYYFDLWIAQLTLQALIQVVHACRLSVPEADLIADVTELFDVDDFPEPTTIESLATLIHGFQRELDASVNNAALSRELHVNVRSTRGRLVFGTPSAIGRRVPELAQIKFAYLLDELENLTERQQKYVNTLLREKEGPVSFIVGSRTYGFRTAETLSAGEVNREGSEFETIRLDTSFVLNAKSYTRFCRSMVAKRLEEAGYFAPGILDADRTRLDDLFDHYHWDRLAQSELGFMTKFAPEQRPALLNLRRKLVEASGTGRAVGVSNEPTAAQIVDRLAVPTSALVEKASILLLYQEWAGHRRDLNAASEEIRDSANRYLRGDRANPHQRLLSYFRGDLVAQLLREAGEKQRYLGVDTFIRMSSGLPRNVMIILKYVYRWAAFEGEDPFRAHPISQAAQRAAVNQASSWFYQDAPGMGALGVEAQAAIDRLGRLFRVLRFSDKPVESSLVSFSVDSTRLSERARVTVKACEDFSLLIAIPFGQRERNTGGIDQKYQMGGMLSPRWDLPVSRRGSTPLSAVEANAIFDAEAAHDFDRIVRARESRVTAPFVLAGAEPHDVSQTVMFDG